MKPGRLSIFCLLALAASAAGAQTRYVSDRLEVTLRTGTSTQHTIVRMLPSGARVEVLEVDAGNGYSRVRTVEGVEGWLLSRYLMDQPAARDQLAAATSRIETLNARVNELSVELRELRAERDTLEAERRGLGGEAEALRAELDEVRRASASALELDRDNRELRAKVTASEQHTARLNAEIAELKANTRRNWFLAGAGVLFGGLLLGLILPSLKFRKRSRWGDL